jgi:hypothetical protein
MVACVAPALIGAVKGLKWSKGYAGSRLVCRVLRERLRGKISMLGHEIEIIDISPC